ncbi:HAD hydrolase-like protein [Umezawaea sp.]|uniref:HAD hydrolase-like protein n=1 Tax=Umezawaea sp. TaxID=1955258 RepID=UPI002ED16992
MGAGDLLVERDHVLVALDGPVAEELPVRSVAERLRVLLAEDRLPRRVLRTGDPYAVLAHAGSIGPATRRAVYAQWRRIEHGAVAAARVAAGVREAFAAVAAAGGRITVVGALDVEAIRAFLVLHGLDEHVRHVVGRVESDHAGPPPVSDLISSAVHSGAVPKGSCVFVGSTGADLAAARAAGVDSLRHHRAAAEPEPVARPNPWFAALRPTGGRRPGAPSTVDDFLPPRRSSGYPTGVLRPGERDR